MRIEALTGYKENIYYSEKQDIATNIDFEAMVTSIKKNLFHKRMFGLVNKLEFVYQKYQTNGTVVD